LSHNLPARVLLAVPNVSEGRDGASIEAIGAAFGSAARLLDVHSDPDHHRSVFTLAAQPGALADGVLAGAAEAVARIDLRVHAGVHPRVGALDVAPVVYLQEADRGAAVAEALVVADRLGEELELPVYLYGDLAFDGRTRAQLRRPGALVGLEPDFGPRALHPTAGAVLVAARSPLVAFNVELALPATLADAKRIAAEVRELPGVRALGVALAHAGAVQVTTNLEGETTPAQLVAAVRRHAEVARAELVAMAPEAAFAGFPAEVPMPGFDPARQLIERAIATYT